MKTLALALLTLALVALVGCADDEASVIDTCQEFCAYTGAAPNCPASVAQDVPDCKAGCAPFIRSLDADCQAALEAVYLCSMSEFTYQCDELNDEPVSEDEGCDDEYAAWGECFLHLGR